MKHFPFTPVPAAALCRAAALLCGLAQASQAAPALPDAGQLSRDLQAPASAPAAPSPSGLQFPDHIPAIRSADATRVLVHSIEVTHSTVFPAAQLQALVADYCGSAHTLDELAQAAARITSHYRAHGYLLARAYLPAQEIRNGDIVIAVLEGVLDQQRLSNNSLLSDALAARYLAAITPGQPLQGEPLDRALLLLSDIPGVGGAHGVLQPGTRVGTSDMLVTLEPGPRTVASIALDNYGNYYTGEYRASGSWQLNNPLGLGDQLNARVLSSGAGLRYIRAGYQMPLGANGLLLGIGLSDTDYQLGQDFAALQAQGSAQTSSAYVSYPFVRGVQGNLLGTVEWNDKRLTDQTGVPATESDQQVSELSLGVSGNRQDGFAGGGVANAGATLSAGQLSMDALSAALDAAPGSAQSQGGFNKLNYAFSRLQNLGRTNALLLSLQGQQANKNLASSEKFALGGASGVRAYPQGEGSGDQGWLASLEWRHTLPDALQGVLFYDTGSVAINHTAYLVGSNNRSIAGVGIGLNGQYRKLQFSTALAWSTSGGEPTSEPANDNNQPRLWLQLVYGL